MSSWWSGPDPVRDGLAGPPHRQRDAQVDVVVVVVLPPREVRRPAGGQAAVEELLLLQGEGGPGRVDGRLALLDGRVPGRLEVVVGVLQQERLDRPEGRGRVLDPARQRDVAGTFGAPAVDLEEVVELGQPGAGRAALGGQRGPYPVGLVRGEGRLKPGRAGRAGQPPQLPVGLHDLGVVALQELTDLPRVQAEFGAHAVEADVVRQQRVHHLEVDLEGALVVLAGLDEVLPQVLERQLGQVHAAEVVPALVDLLPHVAPDRVEVLQERRQGALQPPGPLADLPHVGHRQRRAVGVRAAEPAGDPPAGRQRHLLGGQLGGPVVAVFVPDQPHRGQAARPVEVQEPEVLLVFLAEGLDRVDVPRRVGVTRLESRIPLIGDELVDGNDRGHCVS